MALFSRNKQEPTVVSRISDSFYAWVNGSNGTAPAQTNESALENSAVNCAVSTIADTIGSIPVQIKKVTIKNGLRRTTVEHDHWAQKLLNRPNQYMTRSSFFSTLTSHMVLGKGCLCLKVVVGKEVRALDPVAPNAWTAEIMSDGSMQFRVKMPDGRILSFGREQVLYLHGHSIDGYAGVSSIQKARMALGISNSLEKQALTLMQNGGRPAGIITFVNELSPEKRKDIRDQWVASYSNGNSGTAVLDSGASYQSMAQSFVDSQFMESRKFQIEEIARIFKIHPALLFNGETITREVMNHFHTKTIAPYIVTWEEAIKHDLLKDEPNCYADFEDGELMRASPAEQANYFKQALGAGGSPAWFSVNNVLESLNMDPIDEDWAKVPTRGGYELGGKPISKALGEDNADGE